MSYFRRPLSGVAEYSVLTTGGVPNPPPPPPRPPRSAPRSMTRAYGTLGDDVAPAEMTELEYRRAMLASQKEMVAWQERWVKRDELQRWIQVGATLAIPLSAAIWKMIFKSASKGE